MTAHIETPNRAEIERHLLGNEWTQGEVEDFLAEHAAKVGILSYDEWEDLSQALL